MTTNAAAAPTEIRVMYMGGGSLSRSGWPKPKAPHPVRWTTTKGTLEKPRGEWRMEGTYTDEGKEGSAGAQT
jgi:hypothetical protein